jgi:hypothetical protein
LKYTCFSIILLHRANFNSKFASQILAPGWNRIAYIPQVNETVDEAFAGANPANGDIVKSQTAFSVYDVNVGWVGTLDYLRPWRRLYVLHGKSTQFQLSEDRLFELRMPDADGKSAGSMWVNSLRFPFFASGK